MGAISADWVLLEDGFAAGMLIEHEDGTITNIRPGRAGGHVSGAVLPGMTNLHSHAFQRSFAGRTEFAGGGGDFWSWREAMYRAAGTIGPDTMAPVAAYLAMECLRGGFTSLVEFHYLQNAPDGRPYAHRAAMADAIVAGAQAGGIGLTMLFGVYQTGDFDGAALQGGQVRFDTDPDAALAMLDAARPIENAALRFGVSPHSLRAVPPGSLKTLVDGLGAGTPIHMHLSEQQGEVAACLAALGAPPVAWLLDNAPVSPDWCLIHCTHAGAVERLGIAASGAVVGLCPSTEGNLGDGIFGLPDFVAAGGVFGLGTDSHVSLDAFGELRLLEYSQRLRVQKRNVLAGADRHSGATLWNAACAGGARAAGREVGALRVGAQADLVVIGPTLETEAMGPDFWLDAAIFARNEPAARDVMVGGQWMVKAGRHVRQEAITKAYRAALEVFGMTDAPYQVIKRSIAEGIAAGQWRVGQALPSEHALVRQFAVSRMTVNRAMRELANENVIRRVPGVGSFVAEPAAQSALVEIRNIADEIAARGHVHAARVLHLGRVAAPADVAAAFGLPVASILYFSRILHLEDGVPLQLEQRYVDPRLAPAYLEHDYTRTTPHEYLSHVAPLREGEHQVRAVVPDDQQTKLLQTGVDEACLVVVRRTWSTGGLVSLAELWHPGMRFALSGRIRKEEFLF